MKTARSMTDDELADEMVRLDERMNEIGAEKTRRLIGLDGDIGRREPRAHGQCVDGEVK